MKLLQEFKDIFATHQYHRRNLNIEPVKLALKKEAYSHRIAVNQTTLSPAKTRAAEAIAIEHVNSGFYKPIKNSIHNVPYGMLVKRGADGTPDRFKEFYDFRKLNEYVNIRSAKIPTIAQVTQWMEKEPFILLSKFDKKNWYYQIPLHEDDQQFTTTDMPNGKFIHTAFGYGHANGPATGQDLSDIIANKSIDDWSDLMAWIDDDIMKHLMGAEVPQLIGSVRKYFETVREYNALLNPEKLFVFITGVEYVGFIYNNNGKSITKEYRTNLLAMEKPIAQNDLQNALGSVQFIAPFTPYLAIVLYWLNQLQQNLPTAKRVQTKKTKLKWNKTADEAWRMLKVLIKYTKMVYFVQQDGILLLRGDACSIAMANILYQLQKDVNNEKIWRICGYYSKQFPSHLINHRIWVKEGLTVAWGCKHFAPYLLPRRFWINTDHKKLIKLFTEENINYLNPIIYRLRVFLSQYSFEIRHVDGLQLPLADQMSRNRIKMDDLKLTIWKHKEKTVRDWKKIVQNDSKQIYKK